MDKKQRAQRAEMLLKDELIQEAFSVIEKACYNQIATSGFDEAGKREDAYYFMRTLSVFKSSFEKIIRDGIDTFEMPKIVSQLRKG